MSRDHLHLLRSLADDERHIFRKGWLDQIFPGLEQFEHRYQRRGEGGFDRSWRKDEVDIKVGCACERCNGGWMDELDHAAEDTFSTAAATGHPARIADQLTIARWCALIAILAEQTQMNPVVEPAAYAALSAGDIAQGTHIWLMKTEPPERRAHGWLEPREFELRSSATASANAYFVTFGIHHLVVQVFIPTSSTPPVALERKGNEALGSPPRDGEAAIQPGARPPAGQRLGTRRALCSVCHMIAAFVAHPRFTFLCSRVTRMHSRRLSGSRGAGRRRRRASSPACAPDRR